MTTLFNMTRDINGYNGFGLMPADDKQSTTLSANAAQSFVVPSNFPYWLAIFEIDPGLRVFVAHNTTATLPNSSFGSGVSDLNPTAWRVKAGDTLSFITPDASAYVVVPMYALAQGG